MVAALSTDKSETQLNLASQEWWTGRLLLVALSLGMQKIPVAVVQASFRIEQQAQRAYAIYGQRTLCKRKCPLSRRYALVPWFMLSACVFGSFAVTVLLTSKGLFGTKEFDETGVPCKCRGIAAGENVEADWLMLICMTLVFKYVMYQPVVLFLATCVHLCAASKLAARMKQNGDDGTAYVRNSSLEAEVELGTLDLDHPNPMYGHHGHAVHASEGGGIEAAARAVSAAIESKSLLEGGGLNVEAAPRVVSAAFESSPCE